MSKAAREGSFYGLLLDAVKKEELMEQRGDGSAARLLASCPATGEMRLHAQVFQWIRCVVRERAHRRPNRATRRRATEVPRSSDL